MNRPTNKLFAFRPLTLLAGLLILLATVSACAGFNVGDAFRRPDVDVVGAELTRTGFEGADMLFQFEVDNPNGIALVLDGLNYRLRLNDKPLLNGRQDDRTEIAARTTGSRVDLPVTIRYDDLIRVLETLDDSTHPSYELQADFQFAAPLVGTITVPVTKRGEIPLERLLSRIGRGR
jgi:LEA14-like dessication related protein